jgi:2',3'-cyclic-nucleotide 2'-phosphodiesterase (5'-nucleotidase family)
MISSISQVTLLHTNDIHSDLEAAARIARYVKQIRNHVPRSQLLVLDCGDFLDRSRMETEGTLGGVNRRLLQEIGYDALTIGNNEGLTLSHAQLNEYGERLGIPVVCANFRPLKPDDRAGWLVPSLQVHKAGLNIGLIGLTAPFNDYYELLGWHASDPFEAAAAETARLRSQGADIIIVMSHLGLRQDERLAASVDGIDLILGAHTHHLLEKPMRIGRTAMSAAGKFGRHIGHLTLSAQRRDPSDRQTVSIQGGCLPTEQWEPDDAALAIIAEEYREAKRRMSRVVTVLDEPLGWSAEEESPLSVLLASVVRRRSGAEIGLVNAGQFLDGLPAGEITLETIHALCPSPINCCRMLLTGKEIMRAMEESLLPDFYGFSFQGFGFRGKVMGTLCFDGLEAEVDLNRQPYHRIVSITVNGEPMDPDREYLVGTLDMFTFGVGHTGLKEGRDIRYLLPELIRELLCDALSDRQMIEQAYRRRIRRIGRDDTGSAP